MSEGRTDQNLIQFGHFIQQIRKFSKLRQIDLAYQLDMNYYHYKKIEQGKSNPKLSTLFKLNDFLGFFPYSFNMNQSCEGFLEIKLSFALVDERSYPLLMDDDFVEILGLHEQEVMGRPLFELLKLGKGKKWCSLKKNCLNLVELPSSKEKEEKRRWGYCLYNNFFSNIGLIILWPSKIVDPIP